jgi:hypothetical protein
MANIVFDATDVLQGPVKGSGGRVLVVPRPKHVPRPAGQLGLKGTRGGGVTKGKGGPAPKFFAGRQQGGVQARQGNNRNVKVTIGNKLK